MNTREQLPTGIDWVYNDDVFDNQGKPCWPLMLPADPN
jgi:hypothetical protein